MLKFISYIAIATSVLFGGAGIGGFVEKQNIPTTDEVRYSIEYRLNDNEISAYSNERLELNNEKDAYVVDDNELASIDEKNLNNYLSNGGVLIVADKNISAKQVYSLIDEEPIEFKNSDEDRFGYYISQQNNKNIVTDVTLGYMGEENANINEDLLDTNNISKEDVSYRIVDKVNKKQSQSSSVSNRSAVGQYIAFAQLDNYLYLEKNNKYCCSYTVGTEVWSVAKVRDSGTNKIRGVYDVVSTFSVDAEPKFYVKNYKVRMQSSSTIISASFLNSGVTNTINFGASLGFSGDTIEGSVNGGVSYSFTDTSQKLKNDLPAGSNKFWDSTLNKQYDATFQLKPALRVANNLDSSNTTEYSRVEYLLVKEYSWAVNPSYVMMDKYRKELGITWNANGFVSQNTYTG